MTNEKQYFTVNEALEDILHELEHGYDGHLCDLHHEVFNTDYYIIGTNQAKQALTQYGVFEALEEIQEYENDHFGKVLTDLSNPEHVANMLYYLKGNEAMDAIQESNNKFDEEWNNELNEETRQSLIITIKGLLEQFDSLLEELELLVQKEESLQDNEELTDEESEHYVQIVDILQDNNIEIPFGINI